MTEIPKALDQEFEFDNVDLKLRGQSTFTQLVVWKLGELLGSPLGSRLRRRRIHDLMDTLTPYENDAYRDGMTRLEAESRGWDERVHNGVTWELHWQRRALRLLRSLMFDRDFDGPKDLADEEDLL